eukprot:1747050-Karenia_brevis.AAC.1
MQAPDTGAIHHKKLSRSQRKALKAALHTPSTSDDTPDAQGEAGLDGAQLELMKTWGLSTPGTFSDATCSSVQPGHSNKTWGLASPGTIMDAT